MGSAELGANIFRISQTEDLLKNNLSLVSKLQQQLIIMLEELLEKQ